ncbi:MAG: VOC family protein [Rudaea sp.]
MKIHEMFPYLCVNDGGAAIGFCCNVFGGKERFQLTEPDGRIRHAELELGDGLVLMISDEFSKYGIKSARTIGATPVSFRLHGDEADAIIHHAAECGATIELDPADQFYGERGGSFINPSGHRWNIGHSIETVSSEEMRLRYTEMLEKS